MFLEGVSRPVCERIITDGKKEEKRIGDNYLLMLKI